MIREQRPIFTQMFIDTGFILEINNQILLTSSTYAHLEGASIFKHLTRVYDYMSCTVFSSYLNQLALYMIN